MNQAGSYVGPDRLRFDFTHFSPVTREEIEQIELIANQAIMSAMPMNIYETSLDEARASGVTALFGEKYGEKVRVVEAGEFSRELCGGCHVANTAEIGFLKVVSESSVAANTRRIEAVTSFGAFEYINKIETELRAAADDLHVAMFEVADRAAANARALKEAQQKAKAGQQAAAAEGLDAVLKNAFASAAGYPVVVAHIAGAETSALRNAWDILRARREAPGAAVLAGDKDGTPIIMAAGTDEAVAAGFNAGAIIKAVAPAVKGGGGGKPTMAQAGGKDVAGIPAALEQAREILAK